MFYQIFLSPQVKRCAIITYKHGIYELSHNLPNDLKNLKLPRELLQHNTAAPDSFPAATPNAPPTHQRTECRKYSTPAGK